VQKVLIFALIAVFLFAAFEAYKIQSLEKDVIMLNAQIVQLQTENNILTADKQTKETALSALQQTIDSNQAICEKQIKDLKSLNNIAQEAYNVRVKKEKTENSAALSKKDTNKKKKGVSIKVVDEKSSDKYIQLRNEIYTSF